VTALRIGSFGQRILSHEAVSTVTPAGKSAAQVPDNGAAGDLEPLTSEEMAFIAKIYDIDARPHVHQR
jgi:aryl-alcohol dehydrogenase-like predicted oxidoreductase